jgi:hypothetical protein
VTIEGAQLTAGADYTLEPISGRLARRGAAWPAQDLNEPIFTVDYVRGTAVPDAANLAAGIYAWEWLKGQAGAAACRLPARTREVARAGVTTSLVAPETLASAGLTGVPEVDAFISAVNPARAGVARGSFTRAVEPSAVWSPELAAHRVLEVGTP